MFTDLRELFEELNNDQAANLIRHIFRYVDGLQPEPPDDLTKLLFIKIRQQIDDNFERWSNIKKQRSEAGKLGAEAANASKGRQRSAKPAVTVTVTDTVNDTVNDNHIPFDDVWNLYDKKRGDKTKLSQKWDRIAYDVQCAIMEYIPKYKQAQPDKQYRKDLSTFLNQQAWNDELLIPFADFDFSIFQDEQAVVITKRWMEYLKQKRQPFVSQEQLVLFRKLLNEKCRNVGDIERAINYAIANNHTKLIFDVH